MDTAQFTESATGVLVPIEIGAQPDWAFLPEPLPADWAIPRALWPLIAHAREKLGTLDGIGRTLANPHLLLRPLQGRESLKSSSLEGTHATPVELLLYRDKPREPTSPLDPANDWLEVANAGEALRVGAEMLERGPLSVGVIKAMHTALLENVRGRNRTPGEFRETQVYLGITRRYVPPPATRIDDLMLNLQEYTNTPAPPDDLDPLVRCFVAHYQFEAIHPFLDGNGRVGRAALALMIRRTLNHTHPWLYLSAYFERNKEHYIQRMFDVSARGEWDAWIEFCLRGVIEQADDAIRRCEALQKLRAELHESADPTRPRVHAIIDLLFTTPVLTKTSLAGALDVAYKTAASDIEHLIERGVLAELPDTRHPTVYSAPSILETAYADHA